MGSSLAAFEENPRNNGFAGLFSDQGDLIRSEEEPINLLHVGEPRPGSGRTDDSLRPVDSPTKKRTGFRLSKQEEKEAEERRRQRAERRRELYFKNKNDGQPFKWPVRVLWLDGSTESGDLTLDFQRKTLTFGHMILPLENMNKLAQPSTKKGSKDLVTLSFQNYPTFLIRFEAGDRPCNRCYKLLLEARYVLIRGISSEAVSKNDKISSEHLVEKMSPRARHRRRARGILTLESKEETVKSDEKGKAGGLQKPEDNEDEDEAGVNEEKTLGEDQKLDDQHQKEELVEIDVSMPKLNKNMWRVKKLTVAGFLERLVEVLPKSIVFSDENGRSRHLVHLQEVDEIKGDGNLQTTIEFITGAPATTLEFKTHDEYKTFTAAVKEYMEQLIEEIALVNDRDKTRWKVTKFNKYGHLDDRFLILDTDANLLRTTDLQNEPRKAFNLLEIDEVKDTGNEVRIEFSHSRPYDIKFESKNDCKSFMLAINREIGKRMPMNVFSDTTVLPTRKHHRSNISLSFMPVNDQKKKMFKVKTTKWGIRQERYMLIDMVSKTLQIMDMNMRVKQEYKLNEITHVTPMSQKAKGYHTSVKFASGRSPYRIEFDLKEHCELFIKTMRDITGPELCDNCGTHRVSSEVSCANCGDRFPSNVGLQMVSDEISMGNRRTSPGNLLSTGRLHVPGNNDDDSRAPKSPTYTSKRSKMQIDDIVVPTGPSSKTQA